TANPPPPLPDDPGHTFASDEELHKMDSRDLYGITWVGFSRNIHNKTADQCIGTSDIEITLVLKILIQEALKRSNCKATQAKKHEIGHYNIVRDNIRNRAPSIIDDKVNAIDALKLPGPGRMVYVVGSGACQHSCRRGFVMSF
ncbi:MAG TPA: hypothetical protein VH229_00955, partial [Candidatus Udaeobacter sp.]|nr:hypothetical protein [Candidatus Udaeobacter sp.]